MSVHKGHRQRLKNRFLKQGLSDFEDHNVLELLLFFSIPQGDTNETAHRLLKEFKTLSNVFDADIGDIIKVSGVGEHTASLIKLIPELLSKYHNDKTKDIKLINSTKSAGEFFLPKFYGKKNEEVHVLALDDKRKIINYEKLFEGTVNASQITIRKVIQFALTANATGIIIAHNHPTGVALPSGNDVNVTKKLISALELMSIQLLDHIIVADDDFVSLADSGYFEH